MAVVPVFSSRPGWKAFWNERRRPQPHTMWTLLKAKQDFVRGMTARVIQGHISELHWIDVSQDLIFESHRAVLDGARGWQNRPLVPSTQSHFRPLRVKNRVEGLGAVYVALPFNVNGEKEVLGLWIAQT